YAQDQARFCEVGRAAALVRARSVESVVATLRVASATGTPVVPRGAGTGLAGGANALDGCVLLSLERMDQVLSLDPAARTARVQAGVLNQSLDEAARAHGLMYAPDPASRAISTIGGNVATNAGGACCLKYGVTGDHVLQLKAVLADGALIELGAATRKDVAGLDLKRLLIGSEGTLAVIVEVGVRLLPRRPAQGTLLAFFDRLDAAGRAIVALQAPERLSKLEVMDQTTLRAVEALRPVGLDTDAAALVLAQDDSADAEATLAWAEATAEAHGASLVMTTLDEDEGAQLMAVRSAALPALERLGSWLLDDVAVPVPRLPELLTLCAAAAEGRPVTVGTFGHAGDGNLHPTLVYDGQDPEAEAQARAAFQEIIEGALALGGSVTGEHGVGQLKRAALRRALGARELALMQGIKQVFDPAGILNPGRGY
ncbi:MAG: FAD-binding protein, partial [Alphaproteobacteria bacterium]|nr:FAD-binding protein [Alphaproteobacteria bacterium]